MTEKSGKSYHLIWRRIFPVLLSFAGCFFLPQMLRLDGRELMFTNSILAVAVFVVLLILTRKALRIAMFCHRRQWVIAGGLSFLFCISMAFGSSLDEAGSVSFTDGNMWLAILVWSLITSLALLLSWKGIDRCREYLSDSAAGRLTGAGFDKLTDFRQLIFMIVFILLCWLPVFLAVYPGFFVYDAQEEYIQVVSREFTHHHPLIHVLLLGGMVQAVYKATDSYNLGIAVYTIFQMAVMAVIFSGAVLSMRYRKISFTVRLFTLLYVGFFPVIVMFSLCSAKDGLFTGLFLILFLVIKDLCEKPEVFFSSKKKQLLFILGAAGVMLFRHNGSYALGIFILFLFIYSRGQRKRILFLTAIGLGLYFMFSSGLGLILDAQKGGRQEVLTVPIQQLARVYEYDKENIEKQDLETLYRFLPQEALENYTPKLSDGVKLAFNNEVFNEEPLVFLKLWLRWGIDHPFTYLNAWFMTSYGLWYPDTIIDVYSGNTVFTYTYEDSSYFGYEVEQPGIRESKLPWLNEWYRRLSLEITQQKIPVISMLFAPGFLFWILMFTVGYLWQQKKYKQLIPYLLPLLLWLTVTLGPTYLVRYVVFLWVLLPEMLICLFGTQPSFPQRRLMI